MALLGLIELVQILALLFAIGSIFGTFYTASLPSPRLDMSTFGFASFLLFLAVFGVAWWYGETHVFIQPTEMALIHHTTAGENEIDLETVVDTEGKFRSGIIDKQFFDNVLLFPATMQVTEFHHRFIDPNSPNRAINVRDDQMLDILVDITVHWQLAPGDIDTLYRTYQTFGGMSSFLATRARGIIREEFEDLGISTSDFSSDIAVEDESDVDSEEVTGTRARMRTAFVERLNAELGDEGFTITDVVIGTIDLEDSIELSIEQRNVASYNQQTAEEENVELLLVEQGGVDRTMTRQQGQAEADAESARIGAASQAEVARINAQADADAARIRAQGEADSIGLIGQAEANRVAQLITAYGGAANYIDALAVQGLSDNVEIIYTPDGALPIIRLDSSGNVNADGDNIVPLDLSNEDTAEFVDRENNGGE